MTGLAYNTVSGSSVAAPAGTDPYAERIWLKAYPQGVPADIGIERYSSLVDQFEQCFTRYGTRPAFANMGGVLTYSALDELSRAFAAFLQNHLGLKPGARIAIMLPNLLQFPVALIGALRAGLIVVNTNPLYTPRELHHQLVDSGATAIVILSNCAHVLEKALSGSRVEKVIITDLGDLLPWPRRAIINFVVKRIKRLVPKHEISGAFGFREALDIGKGLKLDRVLIDHADLAMLQYTGGTTAIPKAAMLTHGNLVANTLQSLAWHDPIVGDSDEVVITAIPLYHIFAFTINCLTFLELGALNRLITDPRNLKAFVSELRASRFTCITGVNTLFNHLMNTPGFRDLDFSSLKVCVGGGMAVQRAIAERWKAMTNCILIEGYGLTETSPLVCVNPLDLKEFSGSIGLPVSSTECSIRDDSGAPVSLGSVGELWIRGPQVMKGYWNQPAETAKVLTSDGWLKTGDIASMDERGFMRLVDRKKDMILVSGFNVCPSEIEEVVMAHPGVLEAAVIGVPDEDTGEAVKLVLVRRDPALSAQELHAHCQENLVAYKLPKHIEFRDQLPKSSVGKILRRVLREAQAAG